MGLIWVDESFFEEYIGLILQMKDSIGKEEQYVI
jgi:hypothetical protein